MSSPAAALDKARSGLDEQATGLLGIGVDLVDVDSFRELLESGEAAFVGSVWTETEQRDAEGSPESLAARWAAKEAVMKALGRGLGDIDLLDIEVARLHSGALEVRLHDSAATAAERVGARQVHVSISHDQGWAVAFAIATAHLSGRTSDSDTQEQIEEDQ